MQAIRPVRLGSAGVHLAQGVKAGRWVFASGVMGQDFATGIAADVLNERLPHSGPPKQEKEAEFIFDHVEGILTDSRRGWRWPGS